MKIIGFILACLAGLLTGCSSAPPADSIDLRVMTFNIRYGTANDGDNHWDNRRDMVPAVIVTHHADIVGVQEALHFQVEELERTLPTYSRLGVGRDDGAAKGEYCAIFYRTVRFDLDEHGTFWLSGTPETPSTSFGNSLKRICTWARLIDLHTQSAFYIYNVHLDHRSQPSRERSCELLAERIAARTHDDPYIIAGDFNAAPENSAIQYLLGEIERASEGDHPVVSPPNVIDCYRAANEPAAGEGTFNGFTGETGGARIDYIFAQPGVEVYGAYIVRNNLNGRYPSDHFPVMALVRIPGP